jgi:hypothetical protein
VTERLSRVAPLLRAFADFIYGQVEKNGRRRRGRLPAVKVEIKLTRLIPVKIAIHATSCKISLTLVVQHVVWKKIAILLRVSYKIFSNLVTKSTHSN